MEAGIQPGEQPVLSRWYRDGLQRWIRRWWWMLVLACLLAVANPVFYSLVVQAGVGNQQAPANTTPGWVVSLTSNLDIFVVVMQVIGWLKIVCVLLLLGMLSRSYLFIPESVVLACSPQRQYRAGVGNLRGIIYLVQTVICLLPHLANIVNSYLMNRAAGIAPPWAAVPAAVLYWVMFSEVLIWILLRTRQQQVSVFLLWGVLSYVVSVSGMFIIEWLTEHLVWITLAGEQYRATLNQSVSIPVVLLAALVFFRLNQRMPRDFRGWLAA